MYTKSSSGAGLFSFLLILFLLIGEIKCIIKVFQCNWEPIGKAEIIYTGAAVTGFGGIVGWMNIEDK